MLSKSIILAAALLTASALPAVAETFKWGAIALDTAVAEKEPAYGVGGGANEKEASDAAVKFCKDAGGAKCTLATTYQKCGAVAVSGAGKAGWGISETKKSAEAQALSGCKDDKCSIAVSDCNDE